MMTRDLRAKLQQPTGNKFRSVDSAPSEEEDCED